MRLLRLAIPVALLSLVVACGGSSTTTTPPAAAPTSAPATSSAPTSSSPSPTSSSAGPGSVQVLTGAVNAELTDFTITLKNAAGADVTTLPAGTYQIVVKDPSTFHNFHLTGPGVEQTTSVEGLADPTWTVTLTPGTYTYKCDPHPNMVKTFTVT